MDYPKVLQPGQAGKVKVEVNTGKGQGQHTKTVSIVSNDPVQKTVIFEFSFTVK